MIKRYLIVIVIISMSYVQADEKRWFGELGWKMAPSSITGTHSSFDTSGLHGVRNEWEVMHMFYGELGYMFFLKNNSQLFTSFGLESLVSDSPSEYSAFFTKASVLYPVFIYNTIVNIGPKFKVVLPFSSSYEDTDDGVHTRQVEYDTNVAVAFGIEAVWNEDDLQFVTGIEYLTSAEYSGEIEDNSGYANSSINLNGVYLNLGIRYRF